MKTRFLRLVPLVLLSLLPAACGGLGRLPASFAQFDLGRIEGVTPATLPMAVPVEVQAPSWLESSAMQYRLAYSEPHRRQAYAHSRWVAEPAEMLAIALDRALRAPGAGGGACRLRLRLDEFVQVFDSPESSQAELRARAELVLRRGEMIVAQSDFVVRTPAPTADATGGVAAHRTAAQRLAAELGGWLGALDRTGAEGLNTSARCRS